MKFSFLFILCVFALCSYSQPNRNLRFATLPGDSINLHLDEKYFLIEPTCSSIIRYGHFRQSQRKFFGPFRDVSKTNPEIVIAIGNYTIDGLLDGDFRMNYMNGDVLAEGKFDRSRMVGHWKFYHPGGKLRLEFDNTGDVIRIINVWDITGKQTVTNGTGLYRSDLATMYWEGKLLNYKPDGIWRFKKTDDRTGATISTETFKNGQFVRGSGPSGVYTDKSRILLADGEMLPITNASNLYVSPQSCDPALSAKKIVYAVFRDGAVNYNREIGEIVKPVFEKVDLKVYPNKTFEIKGMIDEKGKVSDLEYIIGWEDRMANTLLLALYRLPYMEPTLIDGKAVKTPIIFKFVIDKAMYVYSHRLLPVK